VDQAREAIILYAYFLKSKETAGIERSADADVLWKQAADTMYQPSVGRPESGPVHLGVRSPLDG
jgi:hypothetical protein